MVLASAMQLLVVLCSVSMSHCTIFRLLPPSPQGIRRLLYMPSLQDSLPHSIRARIVLAISRRDIHRRVQHTHRQALRILLRALLTLQLHRHTLPPPQPTPQLALRILPQVPHIHQHRPPTLLQVLLTRLQVLPTRLQALPTPLRALPTPLQALPTHPPVLLIPQPMKQAQHTQHRVLRTLQPAQVLLMTRTQVLSTGEKVTVVCDAMVK
mmetsp:Transcript_5565/g.8473  ORF Transcript_5565/g.8473 Transcript_5565/m.8473 type:complete len:210 (-) Transcript_5565:252-881(-)